MTRLLLTEYSVFENRPDLLTEEDRKSSRMVMVGILQRADAKNGNGRVYPKRILEREIDNYAQLVKERRALGELDHPDSPIVNLANASHLITSVWWENDTVMGKCELLDTPSGKILQDLARADVKLGISSRALGSTREEGGRTIVESDLQLICFDFVSEPSTGNAFMMKESIQPNIFNKTYNINRILNDILKG